MMSLRRVKTCLLIPILLLYQALSDPHGADSER